MKFLVILICLTMNYLWLKDFDRFDDAWFFRLRTWLEDKTAGFKADNGNAWLLPVFLVYLLLLGLLLLVLWLVAGMAYGVFTMLVHILVVLVAFDRTQPGQVARDFLQCWSDKEDNACMDYLQQKMNYGSEKPQTREETAALFGRLLIHRCFERMFVMFFWYMVAGAIGVAFCYISYQLQDSHSEDQDEREIKFIANIIGLLEWIPVRLLGLTFSLVGNFVRCFDNLKSSFWDTDLNTDNGSKLYDYANCALSGIVIPDKADDSPVDSEAAQIAALQGLLERSQAIWLSVLAIITILGLQL